MHNIILTQGFDDEVLACVSGLLKREFFCRGDAVYLRGEPATGMFFVLKGCVRVNFDGKDEVRGDTALFSGWMLVIHTYMQAQ